jgi:hypothetical protein
MMNQNKQPITKKAGDYNLPLSQFKTSGNGKYQYGYDTAMTSNRSSPDSIFAQRTGMIWTPQINTFTQKSAYYQQGEKVTALEVYTGLKQENTPSPSNNGNPKDPFAAFLWGLLNPPSTTPTWGPQQ